jgi:hypothetical protein
MGAHAKSPHAPFASAFAFLFSALAYKKKRDNKMMMPDDSNSNHSFLIGAK